MNDKVHDYIGDTTYNVAELVLNSIPVGGAIAGFVFKQLVKSPADERRESWMRGVLERLAILEQNDIGLVDKLKHNDEFLDVLYQATAIALRNSKKEKLDALQNAVINSAQTILEYQKELVFINFIDRLTPLHINVLMLVHNPTDWYAAQNLAIRRSTHSGLSALIREGLPNLTIEDSMLNLIWSDLFSMGLQNSNESL